MVRAKVLILGGTGEARKLAEQAIDTFGSSVEIISSQAGVTLQPEPVPGRLVTGGFGGIGGLEDFIQTEQISIVVDATHAFASTISENAYIACMSTKAKRISLVRPEWELPEGANITSVADMREAADVLRISARRVFVTTGRRGLEAFKELGDTWFLVRMIEALEEPLPLDHYQLITGRPPFALADEERIISDHQIGALLTKQSGGVATSGKITAAVNAELPIIMIRRPAPVPGDWTHSIEDCLDWIRSRL